MGENVFRTSLLLIGCLTLNGCGLTKIPESWHDNEINRLDTVGVSLEEARTKATRRGFKCSENIQFNRTIWDGGTERKVNTLQCYKQSLDLICPQTRYVVFNADPRSGKVLSAGGRITEFTCFSA